MNFLLNTLTSILTVFVSVFRSCARLLCTLTEDVKNVKCSQRLAQIKLKLRGYQNFQADRQTDRCQTKASLNASALWGRRHVNSTRDCTL